MMKRCTYCKELKDESEFRKNNSGEKITVKNHEGVNQYSDEVKGKDYLIPKVSNVTAIDSILLI